MARSPDCALVGAVPAGPGRRHPARNRGSARRGADLDRRRSGRSGDHVRRTGRGDAYARRPDRLSRRRRRHGDHDLADTALREAAEETGVDRGGIEVLGVLPPAHVEVSGFDVTAVIAWWREPERGGSRWIPERPPRSTSSPCAVLTDPAHRARVRHPSGYTGPAFEVNGHLIWGLTAHLLDGVLDLAGWQRPWDRSRELPIPARYLDRPKTRPRRTRCPLMITASCSTAGTPPCRGSRSSASDLITRYSEPHRHYHTDEHLLHVLTMIDQLADDHDLFLVRLAAWFHDAVYAIPPGQVSNEEASARLALRELSRVGLEQEDLNQVARLVRLTETHLPGPRDPEGELLCDADLAILAVRSGGLRRATSRRRTRGVRPAARGRLPRRPAGRALPSLPTARSSAPRKGRQLSGGRPGQPRRQRSTSSAESPRYRLWKDRMCDL